MAVKRDNRINKNPAHLAARRIGFRQNAGRWRLRYAAGTFGARLRELRWKNSAWLATADTIAGWNGFEIRKAGSGRSPVRKRSGYAVMHTTGTPKVQNRSVSAAQ